MTGRFDWTRFDPRDGACWTRLAWTARELGREAEAVYLGWNLVGLAGGIARGGGDANSQARLLDSWRDAVDRLGGVLFPWGAKARALAHEELARAWERAYGRPDDPAVVARIEAAVRSLRGESAPASPSRAR